MTLSDIITSIDEQNDEAVIFAKKVDGKFLSTSEAVLVEMDDEEVELPTKEIADKQCPGFDYFLEVSIVKEMVEDLRNTADFKSVDQQVDRIIHYAEFDA